MNILRVGNIHVDMKGSFLSLVFFLLSSFAIAENWPQWRGPDYNGVSAEQGLPVDDGTEGWMLELVELMEMQVRILCC